MLQKQSVYIVLVNGLRKKIIGHIKQQLFTETWQENILQTN